MMKNRLSPEAVAAEPPAAAGRRRRIDSVDLLRGLVVAIMLLDHTREFIHRDAASFSPTDLSRTTVALFFTRWVTHFCAPVFVLLAGTAAALYGMRGKTAGELRRFLVTRGLWLIVLEFTVIRFGMAFDLNYGAFPGIFEVIWAIGVSMILLAAFVGLPTAAIGSIGGLIVALHNLTDGVAPPAGLGGTVWRLLHQPGPVPIGGLTVIVAYPVLPWLGVMLMGYALAGVYQWDPARRRRFLTWLGAVMTLLFVLIRALNVYGDPAPWSHQPSGAFTVLSFLNTTKYPPSLLFLLMTLGPALMLLARLERPAYGPLGRILLTYGRVPLFFFAVQWFVAHPIAIGLSLVEGKPISHLFGLPTATPPLPGGGFSLGTVYLVWVSGLVITYPLCRWFGGVKRRRNDWWLSYL